MQPSEYEIQREVETLRDIKRRSTGPGALLIDPDLPGASSQASSSGYWASSDDPSNNTAYPEDADPDVVLAGDPSHLFWVPARLHPEIAPAEFRQFLKEHAHTPADASGSATTISRSSSISSIALGRKKSMLSRQYKPSENDGVEEEQVMPIRRNRSSVYANAGPQLTISDLQKIEELAEEASRSDDPSRLRSMLRRSLSLNLSPTALEGLEDTDMGDEADSPIIVPRPGQILRRTARTKIRKAGQTSEGPHRFSSARARRGGSGRTVSHDGHTPSDRSSSDHGDSDLGRRSGDSDAPDAPFTSTRPDSYSEEASIYDAYVREEPEEEPIPGTTVSEFGVEFSPVQFEPTFSPPQTAEPQPSPILHHPQPQRLLSPPIDEGPARSPSPESTTSQPEIVSPRPTLPEAPAYQPPPSPSPSEGSRREKDKKGLFGKWGGDKGGKKGGKDSKEKEKDSGFFGSLFGGSNKKIKEDIPPPAGGLGNNGRETAAALLGASKSSKSYNPSPSPQPIQGYARYPIHVERAIYRLSHIKLANPRRPLYEQVLISNLMFWYLGVINKTGPASPAPGNANGTQNGTMEKEQADKEKEKKEKKEREERERMEKERIEKEKAEKRESSRKGSLTKAPAAGTSGARRAEMPVRGPQYDMQHRAMEQEYGGYGQSGNPPMGRTASAPPGPYQPQQSYSVGQVVQPQPQMAPQGRQYNGAASNLPPGAMPPVNVEAGGVWHASPGSAPAGTPSMQRSHTSPSPPPRGMSPPTSAPLPSNPGSRRAKSPPTRYGGIQEKQHSGGGRMPSRSLSANATAAAPPVPPVPNGIKKGNTFHAVPSRQAANEEEDLPLAYYQQQQRRKP